MKEKLIALAKDPVSWVYVVFLVLIIVCIREGFAADAPRSAAQRRHFMQQHPCPAGRDKGSVKHCRGHVVDHIVPLCAGGADLPSNMQWQTVWRSQQKDNKERQSCSKQSKP